MDLSRCAAAVAFTIVVMWFPACPARAALVVPAYNSLVGAHAKLYIDFGGATVATWGSYQPGAVEPYDIDGNPNSFSATELANIRQIFVRVAEKYSPLNVNVTTVDPGNLNNKETARIIVGGDGNWYPSVVGGVAFRGGFTSTQSNIGWAFPDNLGSGNPKTVAEAVAHEAGHLFWLNHQSAWTQNAQGTWVKTEYSTNDNNAARRPVMGSSYGSARGLWWYGTTTSPTTYQDDIAVLAGSTNAFGYRTDDHGDTFANATTLIPDANGAVSSTGIITTTGDRDLFSFVTGTGTIRVNTSLAEFGGMLDSTLQLFAADGTLLQTNATDNLTETLVWSVYAGQYFLGVSSRGNYGDIGQYRLTGQLVPLPIPEPAGLVMGLASLVPILASRPRRGTWSPQPMPVVS